MLCKVDLDLVHKIYKKNPQDLPAAASYIIIICHIDIKHQLLLQGLEGSWFHSVVLDRLWITEMMVYLHQNNNETMVDGNSLTLWL